MSNSTKTLIYETFLKVLETKPFDRITVRDIVENCNINRNTFYYYYSDIYELLEEIFTVEFTEIVANHSNGFRWLVGFNRLLEKSYNNKKIINNICASRSYDYLETYLFKTSRTILADYIHELAGDKKISENQLDFIISFYHYAIVGIVSDWFRTGMQETPREIMKMFLLVFEGIMPSLERAARKNRHVRTVRG